MRAISDVLPAPGCPVSKTQLVEVLSARRELAVLHQAILEHVAAYAAALVQLGALTAPTFPLTQALLLSR